MRAIPPLELTLPRRITDRTHRSAGRSAYEREPEGPAERSVAAPQPKAPPYVLPRGRRKRRAKGKPEELREKTATEDTAPTPAEAAPTAEAKIQPELAEAPEPTEILRLVNGVRWEKASHPDRPADIGFVMAEPIATLGAEVCVFGMVECEGHIEICGGVEGDVRCETVAIAPGAQIRGSIVAQKVWIGGIVEGPVTAHTVTLAKTANVVGSIFHNELHMERGAKHKGRKPWRLNPLENR